MMRCKDCIKYDVCEWYDYVDVQTYSPENCMFFKNKEEYVKVAQDQNKPTRSEQRRINVQQGRPMNEGLEPVTARYIDANVLLEIYKGWLPQLARPEDKGDRTGVETCITVLQDVPTIDVVEVKHGEWYLLDECSNEGVYCSVCHKKVYRKWYANQKVKSNYCPNCGAKMDGGGK